MNRRTIRVGLGRWGLAVALGLGMSLAPPVLAEAEMAGELDGEARQWHILRHGDDSNASFTDLGGLYVVDLVGFVDPDAWRSQEALSISFTLMGEEVTEFDVVHLIGHSALPPVYTSEAAELTLTLEAFEVQGPVARVAGRVAGTLALQRHLGEPPSLEEGIAIDVRFEAEAERVEF
ncbi:hypothetical protein [Halomonas salifodinae]|uniref:hypothetical protein n=1 Tax=Halomonas salifodinae TaxID=438745 RepID=UPI0033BEBBB1